MDQPVDVVTEPDDDTPYPLGRPVSFAWDRPDGRRVYKVREILRSWATARQWWTDTLLYEAPLDVWHYQLEAQSAQGAGVLLLTLDVAREKWVLAGFED
ncbi:DUF6504 family protein [Nonomuraea recticatena]